MITGGSDGLGLALAERLLVEGAHVAVCGRDERRLDALRVAWESAGHDALCVRADVTDPDQSASLITAVASRWGHIDGLVNNAGKSSGHPFDTVDDTEWYADFDLKVHAAVRLIRLSLEHLRAAGGGSVVNVLNIGAKTPGARSLPTTASRAAGLAITKALSKELGADQIRVNAVLVGLVESGQWRRLADTKQQPLDELYAEFATGIPLGRVGTGDDFADLTSFLLSPRSGYVTGSAINLDGGASHAL